MVLYGAAVFCETQELHAVAITQPGEAMGCNRHSRVLDSKYFQYLPNRDRVNHRRVVVVPLKQLNGLMCSNNCESQIYK
jgi:hypothetical protein